MQLQGLRTTPTGLHAGAPLSTLPSLPEVFALVAEEVAASEGELRGLLHSPVDAVPAIGGYLVEAGGKRLRPLLTALGARAVGYDGPISRLMCVGELLHLGSLLHDDVVDDGHERRGQPTAHRLYGNPAVILTGDFCLARSVLLAAEEGGFTAVTELGRTVTAMAEGEVLQLLHAGRMDLDLPTYLQVVEKKSAALISWCAAAGAWAKAAQATNGDAAPAMQAAQALHTFGHEVGIAFQVTDDVLDYVGEKRLTGKRRGQDLAEGKVTLPLVLAKERIPDLASRLRTWPPSPERIPAIIAEVRACGATEEALVYARRRVQRGLDALEILPESPYKAGLQALAHHLVERVR